MADKKLKKGFTTGAAAAAAVKAALEVLLKKGQCPEEEGAPEQVYIDFLCSGGVSIPVHQVEYEDENRAWALIKKDAGDDPDITHKSLIGARVCLGEKCGSGHPHVVILGGEGVGRVTKPGLELPVGEPAINPGPRTMIKNEIKSLYSQYERVADREIQVEIFVPEGEKLAEKTLNARLGILGGISILGTTGVVRPLSHDAYIATIKASIAVARARGMKELFFTTGRRSERHAMDMFPGTGEEAFIQTGDFFKAALDKTLDAGGIERITYVVFFGKAVKMALGFPHTHAAKSNLTLKQLAAWADDITGEHSLVDHIAGANTARHAFEYIYPDHPDLLAHVGREVVRQARGFVNHTVDIRAIILNFDGQVAFDSQVS
ncbi:MAG: cobalt-precorrin-5B (C(1))-methyltransferase CbiD [Desulfobacterales bacterium]|nr:cobalt-precorrin-5B (C(1))-methyltransferase CbiD [Desulfobacterales bacterium]